jgi:hypothetical protein
VALLQEVQGSTPVDFIFTKKKDGVSFVVDFLRHPLAQPIHHGRS